MRYRLMAVDLDGTLLGPDGKASRRNLDAIARAQAAGLLVVPCTGRAWCESRNVLLDFPRLQDDHPGIFVTGAIVADLASGSGLDMAVIEPHLALKLVERLADMPEAVLVFRDANLVGHDYLITGQGTLTSNTQWWFQTFGANVRFQRSVDAEDLHHTLRVGMVACGARAAEATQRVQSLNGQVMVQSFEALRSPDPADNVHVFEVFAAGVDKWRGIDWIARQHDIAPHEVVAIGDEINDISMVKSAGCGIAMSNAVPGVKEVARHHTASNAEDGVAVAIEKIMSGEW